MWRIGRVARAGLPWWLALAGMLTWSGRVRADEPEEREQPETEPPGQRYLGFGPSVGFWKPNGLVVRAGIPAVELEVGGGYMLNYASYTTSTVVGSYGAVIIERRPKLDVFFALQGDADLLVHIVTFRHRFLGGLRAGARYNEALGYGIGVGGQLAKRVSSHWLVEGNWGITVFPDAARNLRGHEVPAGADFRYPPELNWGLNVTVLLYP